MDEEAEITVIVDGRTPNQALFLEEKYWGMPLRDIRDVLTAHNLSLPSQYKFLTKSKNAISSTAEEKITLKRLMDGQTSETQSSTVQLSDGETMEVIDKSNKLPQINIVPVRPKRNSRGRCDTDQQTDADCTFEENKESPNQSQPEETEDQDGGRFSIPTENENGDNFSQGFSDPSNAARCPFDKLNRLLFPRLCRANGGNTSGCPLDMINFKLIFKALFGVTFMLTTLLMLMIITLYTVST